MRAGKIASCASGQNAAAALHTGARQTDGNTIGAHSAGFAEAGRFTGVNRTGDIVDITALEIIENDTTNRHCVGNRLIENHLNLTAGLATFGETDIGVYFDHFFIKVRLIGNQTHHTGL